MDQRTLCRAMCAAAAAIALHSLPARSADGHPPGSSDASQPASVDQGYEGHLLGDLGGLRPWLKAYGATLELRETSEVLGNLTGGLRTGAIYEGLTDAGLTLDFRAGEHEDGGVLVAHALQIHGRGLSGSNLGNLNTASNIEATATTRLRELWYEQHIGGWLGLRAGQQSADTEFIISSGAATLINGTFGWPALPASNLPSGGPAYPLGTPGLRARVEASESLTLLAGVFNGDPAGPGAGDPQRRDPSGTAFRTGDGIFAIAEIHYNPAGSPANGTYKLGAWYNSQPFADLRRDSAGLSLADPAGTGRPLRHSGDYSLYGIVDQPLWAAADGGSVAAFLRAMGAPGDRNLVDFYIDGGLAYRGPFSRANDIAAIGVAYTRIGRAARDFDADVARLSGEFNPVRTAEILVELTYQAEVTPWWQLQPDLQFVVNPGGGIPNPAKPGERVGDAIIVGLRSIITF